MGERGGWVTIDECRLLLGLLVRPRPCGMHELVTSINQRAAEAPPSPRWRCRQDDLTDVFFRLYRRGLVQEAVQPGEPTTDVYELTSAGRHAAVNAHLLWGASHHPGQEQKSQQRLQRQNSGAGQANTAQGTTH